MSRKMHPEEIRQFLLQGTKTAKVATTRRDGRPHVSPVWFMLDENDLVFVTAKDTLKATTLRRDPRVSICVDLEEHPYGFVIINGVATLIEDPPQAVRHGQQIAKRYQPADTVPNTHSSKKAERDPYNRPVETIVRVSLEDVLAVSYDN